MQLTLDRIFRALLFFFAFFWGKLRWPSFKGCLAMTDQDPKLDAWTRQYLMQDAVHVWLEQIMHLEQRKSMQWHHLKKVGIRSMLLANPTSFAFLTHNLKLGQKGGLSWRAFNTIQFPAVRLLLQHQTHQWLIHDMKLCQNDGLSWHQLGGIDDATCSMLLNARTNKWLTHHLQNQTLTWETMLQLSDQAKYFLRSCKSHKTDGLLSWLDDTLRIGQKGGLPWSKLNEIQLSKEGTFAHGYTMSECLASFDAARKWLSQSFRLGQRGGLSWSKVLQTPPHIASMLFGFHDAYHMRSWLEHDLHLGKTKSISWDQLCKLPPHVAHWLKEPTIQAKLKETYHLGQKDGLSWQELCQTTKVVQAFIGNKANEDWLVNTMHLGQKNGLSWMDLQQMPTHIASLIVCKKTCSKYIAPIHDWLKINEKDGISWDTLCQLSATAAKRLEDGGIRNWLGHTFNIGKKNGMPWSDLNKITTESWYYLAFEKNREYITKQIGHKNPTAFDWKTFNRQCAKSCSPDVKAMAIEEIRRSEKTNAKRLKARQRKQLKSRKTH